MDFSYLKQFMDRVVFTRTPGSCVEVRVKGEKVFSYASGYSDIEKLTPMTGNETFQLYSCTKPATMTAALQLLERGLYTITDPISDYIPEFKDMYVKQADGSLKKAENVIKIRDLMSMGAGLNYDLNSEGIQKARELTGGKMDTATVIKCIAEQPLEYEPGTRYWYSLAHDVMAYFIEIVSGMKFSEYMEKNVFGPLEMKSTTFHPNEEIKARMSSLHRFVPDGETTMETYVDAQMGNIDRDGSCEKVPLVNVYKLGPEYESGGAGVVSDLEDYSKFTAMLANKGLGINGERILTERSIDLMRTNVLNDAQLWEFRQNLAMSGYGYGYGVRTLMNPELVGSLSSLGEFGWSGAAGAIMIADPEANLSVFFCQHCLGLRQGFFLPRLRNVVYNCIGR